MKKNITVNLFGTLYAIDDDACKLLEQYLDNMRSYFSKREGGDEITDDIEHRVAELFSELKQMALKLSLLNMCEISFSVSAILNKWTKARQQTRAMRNKAPMLRLLQLLMPLLPHTKAAASSIATLKINS